MAALVVFCTTYALILPAITMESSAVCGLTEHSHVESCYTQITTRDALQSICSPELTGVHTHTKDCCENNVPVCGYADFVVHEHSSGCYDTDGTLWCKLPEIKAHTHEESCWQEVELHVHDVSCYTLEQGELLCVEPEVPGHSHSMEAGCYTESTSLVCTEPEVPGHSHSDSCYTEITNYICGQSEQAAHWHGEGCYSAEGELTCTLPETEGHTHSDACMEVLRELTCGQEEQEPGHLHGDACYETTQTLVCTLEEIAPGHLHSNDCYTWNEVLICEELTAEDYDVLLEPELVCEKEEIILHTHDDDCYDFGDPETDSDDVLICGFTEILEHIHGEGCSETVEVPADIESLTCPLAESEEHTHSALCYGTWELSCGLEEHTHTEECYLQVVYVCGLEEHIHGETCYNEDGSLFCQLAEHTHTDACVEPPVVYYCGLEAHTHSEACYDEEGNLTCTLEEHVHTEECTVEPVYYCGLEAHTHSEVCYDEEGNLICGLEEHTHSEACAVEPLAYICGMEEHTHSDKCYDENGDLVCGLEEHTHSSLCLVDLSELSEEDRAKVERVIRLIDAMPSADQIDAKIAEFEEAEDYEGEEAWLTEVYQQVGDVYFEYLELGIQLRSYVVNADKLLELEYIWSAQPLITEIDSDAPTVIRSASTSEFIELNLYDYNSKINTNYNSSNAWPGFQWNGGAYNLSSTYNRQKIDFIDFGNSLITDFEYEGTHYAKATSAQNIGNQGGNINKIFEYPSGDWANKPIGMSTGTEVLDRTLNSNGYPQVTNAGSMAGYFSNSSFATKLNTNSIDGLFQKNEVSGEYYYNSRWNHAQYNYNDTFTLYEDIITPNFITYPFGNFLPLNTITDSSKATQVSKITHVASDSSSNREGYIQILINRLLNSTDPSEIQLWNMLAKYRDDLGAYKDYDTIRYTWSAKDAILDYIGGTPTDDTSPITDALLNKMYNIDWDVETNFFFGMEMKMNFMQPKGGMTGNDTNQDGESDYPMVFYFTGDDDVWVYVDDVLFLDLSGIHRHVGGKIDFVNGKVYYYALDTETGDVSSTPYATYTFAQLLTAAGKSTNGLNSNGTFADYTTHKFNFYYMERGSGSSVCRLNFNFPLLRQNSISVSKEVSSNVEILGNPDYKFQVLKADSSGNKTSQLFIATNTEYTIYDANDNKVGTGTTDANGVFTLKAGQRAEFTGIKENAGKYYVRELLEGTVLEQYGNVTVSGESTTTSNNVTVGSDTFTGMDSPVKDMSSGATFFRFTNTVDGDKLGRLSISKQTTEYIDINEDKTFDIEVTLDGEKLPVGTEYTVGIETRTVETEGIITISANEEAVITNVLAGTAFTVKETDESADGYIVTYLTEDGRRSAMADNAAVGTIEISADVKLIVNNRENGVVINIPGTKSMSAYDGTNRTYTFVLTEVTDETGETVKTDGITASVTADVSNAARDFEFSITYEDVDMENLPKTLYYRITESPNGDALTNGTAYVVEVKIIKGEDDGPAAEITRMWKNGTELSSSEYNAVFTNTLKGDLSVTKKVEGSSAGEGFSFTVELAEGSSGVGITTYPVTLYQADGSIVERTSWTFSNGVAAFNDVKNGETFVIHDLPYGTTWAITETNADGYKVTTTVTVGENTVSGNGTSTTGSATAGNTEVVYTNTYMYELPYTGGAGTTSYTMAGLVLILISAASLLYTFKARRREVS